MKRLTVIDLFKSTSEWFGHRTAPTPAGSQDGNIALANIVLLSSTEAFKRLRTEAGGLTSAEASSRLKSVGPNDVAHEQRQTILGGIFTRSINPLNLLLLGLAGASFFLGDQRAAIVIAIMVALSVSLSCQSARNFDLFL